MAIHYYTSISFTYLDRAMVLLETMKRFHPDWVSWLFINDRPGRQLNVEGINFGYDHVVYVEEMSEFFPSSFIFKHNVIELCTAIKGVAMQKLLAAGADSVVYLDPDIALFGELSPVVNALESKSIVVTPHVSKPEHEKLAIMDNEIGSLKHGIFNLGFIAVRNDEEGKSFARWWSERLSFMCYEETWHGVYTDQKWCDLIPCFFDSVAILRHPGLNVASWNIGNRRIRFDSAGELKSDDVNLIFYHFTKIQGPGLAMTDRYVGSSTAVYELIKWYYAKLIQNKVLNVPKSYWSYGVYSDGSSITPEARRKYRSRSDLQTAFPNPFAVGPKSFKNWWSIHSEDG